MKLTDGEVEALIDFFMKCGYISHEFHPHVHKIIKRLEEYKKEKITNQSGENENAVL
jgi:hypothetical protein